MSEKKLVVQQKIVDDIYMNAWVWQIVVDDVIKKTGEEKTFVEAYAEAKQQLAKIR